MLYYLYCALIMAGYSAVGLLLGSYMMLYGRATELELGYLFMIQPLTIFLRPLICARADRLRAHQKMMATFALLSSLSYLTFILIPLLIQLESFKQVLTIRRRFWILVCSHLFGSLGFCGVRSLGDALAVNYAKRTGSDFARYRKYGAISFGLCAYLLGSINQNWILPDFVPSLIVHSSCLFVLSVLVYFSPSDYFVMVSNGGKQTLENSRATGETNWEQLDKQVGRETKSEGEKKRTLSVRQQVQIFAILLRRDFRICLFLLLVLYGGLIGYSGPNFVFTYLNKVCHERDTCDAAHLSGLVMLSYCTFETICYIFIDKMRNRLRNLRLLMLQVSFLSLALHYYFFGFVLDQVSPYFFLVESLHGLEYSISLSTSLELGYTFASQVQFLLPELVERRIVGADDDEQLVKVSLMATMSGCFTLVYEGIGSTLGSLLFGLVTGHFSFRTTWLVIGTMASSGFVVVAVAYLVGRCLQLRPTIMQTGCAQKAPKLAS